MRLKRTIATASFATLACTAAPAAPALAGAPPAPPQPVSLGAPLSDVLLIGGVVAPGPGGEPALWNISTGKPAYLNALDPATGERLVTAPLPGGEGGWAMTAAPDGSIYAGTYQNGRLYRWRPGAGDTVEDLGQPIPGQPYIWRLTTDDQGNVYGGTSPGGKVFRYDAATGQVRDYGQPVPGQGYVKSIAHAGGKIYTGSYAQAHIAELDTATGQAVELPSPPGLTDPDQQVYDINAYGGRLYVRIGTAFPGPMYVWDIAARAWVDEIPDAHGLDVAPPGADGEIYLIQKSELKRYDPVAKTLTGTGLTFTGRVQNARSIGWAELDLPDYPGKSVVGTLWRGEMFRYNPQTGKSAILPSQVRREPIEIMSLAAGRTRAYAGGFLNGGLSLVDPATGAATFNRFSQIESIMETGTGEVWIGAYPEARVYRYDPALPWSSPEYSPGPPGTADNPRQVLNLKPDLQMRAKALAQVDGKIAIGTVPEGDRLGGALVLYDPATGGKQVMRNIVQDESVHGLTASRGVVYGGTSIYGGLGTTPPTRADGAVFAYDVARGRKLWEVTPAPGAPTVGSVVIGPDRKLWGIAGKNVFALDPRTGKVVRRIELGTNGTGGDIVATRRALYASLDGRKIYRLTPRSPHAPKLVVDHPHRRISVREGGPLYFSEGAEMFRIDIKH
ncbi:PQQ-binding-like beta-propeller repeat protein [Spirillospora sp. NPDC047279]|uniref:outer membrane protein assembly factor BamB family protein n=1 Tax=Spirillospora sp. NPDC047279 TaxID=3155478 RepID=UPI0033F13D8C